MRYELIIESNMIPDFAKHVEELSNIGLDSIHESVLLYLEYILRYADYIEVRQEGIEHEVYVYDCR